MYVLLELHVFNHLMLHYIIFIIPKPISKTSTTTKDHLSDAKRLYQFSSRLKGAAPTHKVLLCLGHFETTSFILLVMDAHLSPFVKF